MGGGAANEGGEVSGGVGDVGGLGGEAAEEVALLLLLLRRLRHRRAFLDSIPGRGGREYIRSLDRAEIIIIFPNF